MSGAGNTDIYVSTYRKQDSGRWLWRVTHKGEEVGYVRTDTKSSEAALLEAMEVFGV